jgi:hypothetical protein
MVPLDSSSSASNPLSQASEMLTPSASASSTKIAIKFNFNIDPGDLGPGAMSQAHADVLSA